MKEYDVISIGTGSGMNVVSAMIQGNPNLKIAVVEKDEPGGICLTRGCIPSKILLYPAELVRTIGKAKQFGIAVEVRRPDFKFVMERMRTIIGNDVAMIREGLSSSPNIDYYPFVAEFVEPYTLRVGKETIRSKMIFLCTGSRPSVPPIEGLDAGSYLTSDTVLRMARLPESITIVGGGYIAAEYGHFFSAMGSKVVIIGRNPQFLPQEEPEVSALALKELSKYMKILVNHEVREVLFANDQKKIVAVNRETGQEMPLSSTELLVATGRSPNTDILHPEKAGIATDEKGWIAVNEYLETSQPNVWAFGDANGKHLFKHVANYESMIVYYNAVLRRKFEVDYHAIPHAIFTHPEIASVGVGEKAASAEYGKENVLIGFYRYQDTAKGEAMGAEGYFVKVIVEKGTMKILGAHIIGPYASVLIQEIVNLLYTSNRNADPIISGMHIHPALNEVVERAFRSLMSLEEYHHFLYQQRGILGK